MKRLALSASMLSALALAACGGDDGVITGIDGGLDGQQQQLCNPQTQAGCEQGEKCSALLPPDGMMGTVVTACVPDGTVADGDACMFVDAGNGDGTRTDDCQGGLFCDEQNGMNVCTPVCGLAAAGACADDADGNARACVGISGVFDDLPQGSETGVCVPQCDPVAAADDPDAVTCPDGQGCYGILFRGEFVCLQPAMGAMDLKTGDACAPKSSSGFCFLNSSPPGSTAFYPDSWTTQQAPGVVSPWCKPFSIHSMLMEGPRTGDDTVLDCSVTNPVPGAANHDCRFVNSIFSNDEFAAVDDVVGVCVRNDDGITASGGWNDDPTTWDLAAFMGDQDMDPTTNPFCPGCVRRELVFPAGARRTPQSDMYRLSEEQMRNFAASMGFTLEEMRAAVKSGKKLVPKGFPTASK